MSLRHALLGMLATGPASGYDLAKRFDRSAGFVWSANHSQIYPELARLADRGHIEVVSEGARNRKEYAITDAGRVELRSWLLGPDPEHRARSESLLRVFFLGELEPGEARQYLERQRANLAQYHAALVALEAEIPWDDSVSDHYGRIVLEEGLRVSSTLADWAAWALDQERPTPPG